MGDAVAFRSFEAACLECARTPLERDYPTKRPPGGPHRKMGVISSSDPPQRLPANTELTPRGRRDLAKLGQHSCHASRPPNPFVPSFVYFVPSWSLLVWMQRDTRDVPGACRA